MTIADPRQQRQQAKMVRQDARAARTSAPAVATQPAPAAPPPAPGTPPPGVAAPPAAAPPAAASSAAPLPAATPPRTGREGAGGPYGYQGATAFGNAQQETGTQYEQDVLAGKYLDPGANPYLAKYTDQLGDQFQRQLGRSLSQVSSPFMSGATLGATGIHGASRAQHGAEAMNDFQTGINKIYVDEYGRERGMQGQVSQDIGQRTMNMRDQASRNYGSDQQFRGQIQSAKIQAQSALQQAQMAQQLGYDQLASDMMLQYEKLNQDATRMEQDWILGSGQAQAGIMKGFSETDQQQYGAPQDKTGSTLQGVLGGALGGLGAMGNFGGGGGGGGADQHLAPNAAGAYFAKGGWGNY